MPRLPLNGGRGIVRINGLCAVPACLVCVFGLWLLCLHGYGFTGPEDAAGYQ